MAELLKFRSAFSGFNRVDVVNYIERSASEHQRALRCLQAENTELSGQLSAVRAELSAGRETPAPSAPEPSEAAPVQKENWDEMELAAYRRAEAAERSARARVQKLSEETDAILADAARRFGRSGQDVRNLTEELAATSARLDALYAELNELISDVEGQFTALDGGNTGV